MKAAIIENTKICTGCKKEMLATKEFFHSQKGGKYGLNSKCKPCTKAKSENYYKKNSKKVNEISRKWRKDNPEKVKERSENYYKKNRKKVNEISRKWKKENRKKVNEIARKWYKENPEKCKEKGVKYRENNPEKFREYSRKSYKKNTEKCKERSKINIENLTDSYVATRLKKPVKHLNPQIIETKRLIILIKRELRKNNFKTLETMQEDSTNKNNSQMENNLKENDNKRDLNFEVKNSDDLNKMLSGFLMDVRRGSVTHYSANSINLVADKINKNNCNQLEYKRLSGGDKKIDFFEDNK